MTRKIGILVLFWLITSCNNNHSPNNSYTVGSHASKKHFTQSQISTQDSLEPLIPASSESAEEKQARLQNTIYTPGSPKISLLPFGAKGWSNAKNQRFYFNLIGKNLDLYPHKFRIYTQFYRLPKIEKIKYFNIDTVYDNKCTNGQPIDSIMRLTKYRYKLPRIGIYECYYMCNYQYSPDWDYTPKFIKCCSNYIYQAYGYLILYDRTKNEATVLDIFHSYYVDAVEDRIFYIDKKFTIYLRDDIRTGGDDPTKKNNNSGDAVQLRKISISKMGKINVLRLN